MSAKTNKSVLLAILVILIILIVPANNIVGKTRTKANLDDKPAFNAVLGFDNMVSDILWIELIQYYGDIKGKITPEMAQNVYDRFDRITRYDPSFIKAYKFAALFLFEKPQEAVGLLQRALTYNKKPGWELPFFGGFICYFQLKDYDMAVKFFEESVKYPDRPPHIDRLLAQANKAAGHKKEALELWNEIYRNGEGQHRNLGEKFLKQLAEEIINEPSSEETLRKRAQEILQTL